jgi:hypothetical protein
VGHFPASGGGGGGGAVSSVAAGDADVTVTPTTGSVAVFGAPAVAAAAAAAASTFVPLTDLPLSIVNGGTGSSTAAAAAVALGVLQEAKNLSDVADAGSSKFNLQEPMSIVAACVATTNQASLSGLLTIDGYTLVAGDDVLLVAQTTASQNGWWKAGSGAWTRPTSYPSGGVVSTGSIGYVKNGTQAGSIWECTTEPAVVVDTTATTWVSTFVMGLQYLTGGGTITNTTIANAIAAGYTGLYLDPRYVWNMAGVSLSNTSNFTFESRMGGSIGYANNISYNTGGYVSTGSSSSDGIQLYSTTGNNTQGLVFRGLAFVGTNTGAAVIHLGGGERGCRFESCFAYNLATTTNSFAVLTDTALGSRNGENQYFNGCAFVSGWSAIGIDVGSVTGHANDSLWIAITTSGGVHGIYANGGGGNHQFYNYYDRSNPTGAVVYNNGCTLSFVGGEDQNGNTGGGGGAYCHQVTSNGTNYGRTILTDRYVTATAGGQATVILVNGEGTVTCRGSTNFDNTCTINMSSASGVLDLADPRVQYYNVTVSGAGSVLLPAFSEWSSVGGLSYSSFTGSVQTGSIVAEVNGTGFTSSSPASISFQTPAGSNSLVRVTWWLHPVTAGTSSSPALTYTTFNGTYTAQGIPVKQGGNTALTLTCAATSDYMGDTTVICMSNTTVTATITQVGSTIDCMMMIEYLGIAT